MGEKIMFSAEEFQRASSRRHRSSDVWRSWRLVQTQRLFDGAGVRVPFEVFPSSEAFVLALQLQPAGHLDRVL